MEWMALSSFDGEHLQMRHRNPYGHLAAFRETRRFTQTFRAFIRKTSINLDIKQPEGKTQKCMSFRLLFISSHELLWHGLICIEDNLTAKAHYPVHAKCQIRRGDDEWMERVENIVAGYIQSGTNIFMFTLMGTDDIWDVLKMEVAMIVPRTET